MFVDGNFEEDSRILDEPKSHYDNIDIDLNIIECFSIQHEKMSESIILFDVDILITSSYDKTIKIINFKEEKILLIIENGHSSGIYKIEKLNDSIFFSCSHDNTMKFWNVFNGCLIRTFQIENSSIYAPLVINDNIIGISNKKGDILFYNISHNNITEKVLTGHEGEIKEMFIIDFRHIIAYSEDNKVKMWDIMDYEFKKNDDLVKNLCSDYVGINSVIKIYDSLLVTQKDLVKNLKIN